jgi:DNA-directed RNA polymerase specialized sigma24 family protein
MGSIAEDILMHYGMPRRSGRYPYGSGEDPYQHNRDFLSRVEELKKSGWEETPENIQKEFGMTTSQYRTEKSIARNERRMLQVARAKSLQADGKNPTEIGREMGVNESTVRSWLNAESEQKMNKARETANFIRDQIESKGMIDVGAGVERELHISKEKLNQALTLLEGEGYPIYGGRVEQVTNKGNWTSLRVICPKGTEHKEIFKAFDEGKIGTLNDYTSHDNGESFVKFEYPKSMDSSRLMIRYKDDVGPDGARGIDKDGVIELRRGVKDLSLGDDHYSQVRILVDNNKFLKGMAVYSDDMPDGVDVIFNTNKGPEKGKLGVLKDIKSDPSNPFGSLIKPDGQSYYTDENGQKQLSLINKRANEGDWSDWKNALPSQFLSKQPISLAKKQLNLATIDKEDEYENICALTNPTLKKYYLNKFADECDSAAVHLQAAALPRQQYHVILPINSLKDTEVYAPNYATGTQIALIRYPHGGTFEIPILTVNNKHAAAKQLLGNKVRDAIGINSKIAERLSGADFDGDTVMCIPTNDPSGKVRIKSTRELKGLEGFDPKTKYAYSDEEIASGSARLMSKKSTQIQMGIISNLITDMTLQGAKPEELAAAVRHSMVVIDAEKHKLNYKQSEIDNNIAALHKRYQGKKTGGASTLISKSKGEYDVVKRQGSPIINKKGHKDYDPTRPEGALIYKKADDADYIVTKVNKKTGEATTVTKTRMQKSTNMAETDDARTLISDADTPMERIYADYANNMKALANKARLEMTDTGKIAYSATAKSTYQAEVKSLDDKLNTAMLNAPRERQAQLKAHAEVKKLKDDDPSMTKEDIKKASQRALTKYRTEVGAVARRDRSIKITDREWEAIQAGAISENKLVKILNNTDPDNLRQRAMPRSSAKLSPARINKIKAMGASNYSLEEIATACGVSTSTVTEYLKGVN